MATRKWWSVWIFTTWGDLSFLLEINRVKILSSFWNFLILHFIDLLMVYINQVYSFHMVYGTPLQWMFCHFSIIFSYQWRLRMKQRFYFIFLMQSNILFYLLDFMSCYQNLNFPQYRFVFINFSLVLFLLVLYSSIYLLLYLWLCCIFIAALGLSPVAASFYCRAQALGCVGCSRCRGLAQ